MTHTPVEDRALDDDADIVGNFPYSTNATVKEIKKDAVIFEQYGEIKNYGNVDTVVLALGSKSYNPLEEKLKDKVKKLVVVGDALKVDQGIEAIEKGYMAGCDI